MTDAERLAAVKKVLAKNADVSKSASVKAVRASGISAAGKRIRAAFDQATKSGKSKASSKK